MPLSIAGVAYSFRASHWSELWRTQRRIEAKGAKEAGTSQKKEEGRKKNGTGPELPTSNAQLPLSNSGKDSTTDFAAFTDVLIRVISAIRGHKKDDGPHANCEVQQKTVMESLWH